MEAMTLEDTFRGSDDKLISCIESLIHLNDAGALVPHGIGGHARALLSAAAVRLNAQLAQPAQAVDVGAINGVIVDLEERARNGGDAFPDEFEGWADQLTRALSVQKAGPVGDEWQPIETAPKDGTSVLVAFIADGERQVSEAYWSDDDDVWVCSRDGFMLHSRNEPTHFQPMPTLPASPTPGKEG